MKALTLIAADILLVGALILFSPRLYQISPLYNPVHKASAVIHPTKNNNATGTITFTQEKDGVRVVIDCQNLTPGKHAFHIHEFGDCTCDDAMCTGGHYNPTHEPHGGPNSPHRHVGDFGNLDADAQGHAHQEFLDTHVKLNGIQSIIGRAIIIHVQEDDFVTQPSGNAGARVGCGVIGIAEMVKK